MDSLQQKAEQFLIDSFTNAGKPTDIVHGQRTAYWISHLKADADEALMVAGLLHDIERAFHGDWKKGSDDPAFLRKHQELSAKEAARFLEAVHAGRPFIERVKHLILKHEEGGDAEQNILCDADCLAFFEEKALRHAKEAARSGAVKAVKRRLDHVLSRVSSREARRVAQVYYTEAMIILGVE
ncbi:DUF4202 domain-containing protein [Candidatus Falkowbacteria bacterium]|nr:DUF4202 domain-containing protein [Candidatus Falkowbacteria bacterium]